MPSGFSVLQRDASHLPSVDAGENYGGCTGLLGWKNTCETKTVVEAASFGWWPWY